MPHGRWSFGWFLVPLVALGGSGCRDEPLSPDEPKLASPGELEAAVAALVLRNVRAGMSGHTCAVTTNDLAYCWGLGGSGAGQGYSALGDGTDLRRIRPVAVVGGLKFRQVTAGWDHSCGVTTTDEAYCWGLNLDGILGTGGGPSTSRPVKVSGGLRFRGLEAGAWHTCGLTLAGKAYCWGNNTFGNLGDGTTTHRSVPVAVLGNHTFTQISASWEHTCAIKASGEAWCWGANRFGQLGIGNTISRKQRPTKVVAGLLFAQISTGGMQQHGTTCAVTMADKAYCWGDGSVGQRGDGTLSEKQYTPMAVSGSQLFRRISVGFVHVCAITTGNRAWCWGNNFSGQLGDGTTMPRTRPVRVAGTLAFAQVSAGSEWTCGVTTGGAGYCWGLGLDGALGNGTTDDRHTPTPIAPPM
jgi:alpha-tubulin suppressor-like RCC1 family protein